MHWIAPDPSPRFALTRAVVTAIAVCLIAGLVLAARDGGFRSGCRALARLAVGLAEGAQRFRYDMARGQPAPGRRAVRGGRGDVLLAC